jgi:hypothetical protein
VNPPANDPEPITIVDPLLAHPNAPAIVANGFACEAEPHAGSDDADDETYRVEPAASADEPPNSSNASNTRTTAPRARRTGLAARLCDDLEHEILSGLSPGIAF